MNYQTMADIFRGLAQTGTWGCFDEFNRISIEVLSVVATQVKTVQDCIKKLAIPGNRELAYQSLPPGLPPVKIGEFLFEGDLISLVPTCGFYITMNPGAYSLYSCLYIHTHVYLFLISRLCWSN